MEYTRQVYTMGDMFSQIGGIFEVLLLFGGFIVGMFSIKLYMASLLSKLYQVEKVNGNNESYPGKVTPHNNVQNKKQEDVNFNTRVDFGDKSKNTADNINTELQNSWDYGSRKQSNTEMVEWVRKSIHKRKSFKSS